MREAPLPGNIEYSALCRQAEAVGGDFYDFQVFPNGDLGVMIGDVCGKGYGAALMMANLLATLRALTSHWSDDLDVLIETANCLFHNSSLEESYSTLFYGAFNPATRMLTYVNAGHIPPMVVSSRGVEIQWLSAGGAPLGMFGTYKYEAGSVVLGPGDMVIAYTDGVVETRNTSGEEWGIQRLISIARDSRGQHAKQVSARITKALDSFADTDAQQDDRALLILKAL